MNVLFCDEHVPTMVASLRAELSGHDVRTCPEDSVIEAVSDIDVILPARGKITAAVMDAAPRLRLIQQAGIGTDMVDHAAALARQIPVANVPAHVGGLGEAVAEMGLFLLIGGGRQFPRLRRAIDDGAWQFPHGTSLFGARVCLVGVGGIGSTIARLLRPFHCELVGVKRTPDPDLARELGLAALYTSAHLVEAVRDCQFLVLAVPLDDRTHGLIDAEVLQAMQPGSIVVNVARGPIIDRDALEAALRSGHIAAAGLDVFWDEPLDPRDSLLELDVLATPHAAGACNLFATKTAAAIAANIRRLADQEPLEWLVNPA